MGTLLAETKPPERLVLLYGWKEITGYCRKKKRTLNDWVRYHGFPVAYAPNGMVMTSVSLIDAWVMARARLYGPKPKPPAPPPEDPNDLVIRELPEPRPHAVKLSFGEGEK